MSRHAAQAGASDAELPKRQIVAVAYFRAEQQITRKRHRQPAVEGKLILELPRPPAAIAEREYRLGWLLAEGHRLEDVERRGQAHIVVDDVAVALAEIVRRM